MKEIVADLKDFWPIDYAGKEVGNKQRNIFNRIFFCFKIYFSLSTCIMIEMVVPYFEKHLPYTLHFPLTTTLINVIYIWLSCNGIVIYFFFHGIQLLLYMLLAFSYGQIMMLRKLIQSLDFENVENKIEETKVFKKIKYCVEYHIKLLR